jgi:hypothetical protein
VTLSPETPTALKIKLQENSDAIPLSICPLFINQRPVNSREPVPTWTRTLGCDSLVNTGFPTTLHETSEPEGFTIPKLGRISCVKISGYLCNSRSEQTEFDPNSRCEKLHGARWPPQPPAVILKSTADQIALCDGQPTIHAIPMHPFSIASKSGIAQE